MLNIKITLLIAVLGLGGCSHVSKFALMSNGDLEGKTLSGVQPGKTLLQGESCGHSYSLADAVENALMGTPYDTLLDIEVESTSGILVVTNCVKVKGYGVNSELLEKQGVKS